MQKMKKVLGATVVMLVLGVAFWIAGDRALADEYAAALKENLRLAAEIDTAATDSEAAEERAGRLHGVLDSVLQIAVVVGSLDDGEAEVFHRVAQGARPLADTPSEITDKRAELTAAVKRVAAGKPADKAEGRLAWDVLLPVADVLMWLMATAEPGPAATDLCLTGVTLVRDQLWTEPLKTLPGASAQLKDIARACNAALDKATVADKERAIAQLTELRRAIPSAARVIFSDIAARELRPLLEPPPGVKATREAHQTLLKRNAAWSKALDRARSRSQAGPQGADDALLRALAQVDMVIHTTRADVVRARTGAWPTSLESDVSDPRTGEPLTHIVADDDTFNLPGVPFTWTTGDGTVVTEPHVGVSPDKP